MHDHSGQIRQIVNSAIAIINAELVDSERIGSKGGTPLVGLHSTLNSLHIINLVLQVEEDILEQFQIDLSLTDDETFFDSGGPLCTIDTFVFYLCHAIAVEPH